ncbi:tetratricopeptide repeat protein [uncultured Roseobacter sp.]|uniref:tetratricopeptide repeat protein n=1 Tax=uncultured Roseobacter sp. TaxID=114847 RepID=UPI0026244776|nr:tetratricopeptide repeat protein [uncultured Roseobacter sp.]
MAAFLALAGCKSAEERANEHFENGQALLESGDVDRAILEFRNVFQLDATHLEARRALGEVYLEQKNDKQRAYRQFLRIIEQYPDDVDTRIILTEIALGSGNLEEVERHGSHIETVAPEDPRVQAIALVRAYGAAAREQDEPARREVMRQATAMLEDQPDSMFLKALIVDAALRDGDFDVALSNLDWMLERDPDNQRMLMQRLDVLGQMNDDAAIEAQLQDMIVRFPDNETYTATLIRFYLSRNSLDKAEAFLRDRADNSEDTGPRMDLIRFLVELRGAEAAREELQAAASEADDPVPFQLILAGLDFEVGDQQQAIASLEELVRDAENNEDVLNAKIALARMQLATGNEVGARARVTEVLAADEGHAEALKMQAAWQIEADEADNAIAGLRLALDRVPNDAQAMTLMAQAYQRSGRPELAQDFMALAVEASGNAPAETIRYAQLLISEERYLSAEDILLSALRIAPQDLDLLLLTGELYMRMDDLGRVEQVVQTLRRLDNPRALPAANRLEAERINRQSGAEEAMSYLEELADSADASLGAQLAVVQARLTTGNVDGALELIRTLREEMPDEPVVIGVQASVEAIGGNLDEAETLYRQLVQNDPQISSDVWLELARLKVRQENPDASRDIVDEALTHMPEDPKLLWAKASHLEQDGQIDEAITIYEGLYARSSSSAIVANNLASLLATHKQDAESLERAWVVARRFRDVEVPALQDTYGWILHRRGNSEEALPYLEDAAEGLAGDPVVQYHLGEVYLALGRSDEALKQFQAAVSIAGPADQRDQIARAKEQIQNLQAQQEN